MSAKAEFGKPSSEQKTFVRILSRACSVETCYPPIADRWTEENPFYGHCAVIAELVRRNFGGKIAKSRVTLADKEKVLHYWNLLDDGSEWDVSDSQFKDNPIVEYGPIIVKDAVTSSETRKRVRILRTRLAELL
jgi:hypothetical protein